MYQTTGLFVAFSVVLFKLKQRNLNTINLLLFKLILIVSLYLGILTGHLHHKLMTDSEIIDKICKGDHSAFQWLYQNYYIGLCTYALRFTKHKSTAEEIVQKSIFSLWEKRESLQINESIVAYLFGTVKNNCLNHLKHQQIVNRFNENIRLSMKESEEAIAISQETGLSIYIAQELENRITEAVEQLPEQCREIFKMSRFDGLKYHEIAKIKGISLNTVQKQISIALKKLRISLSDYLPIAIFIIINTLGKN